MEAHLASGDRSVIGFLRSVPVLSPIDVDALALTDVNSPSDLDGVLRSGPGRAPTTDISAESG
jgi:hypothetical protein